MRLNMSLNDVPFPIIVEHSDGSMSLMHSDRSPRYTFEDIDAENREFVLWDAGGRGVSAFVDAEDGMVKLRYDQRGQDDPALADQISRYAATLGWSEDVRALLEARVPYPIIVRYLVWARKHKRGPESSTW